MRCRSWTAWGLMTLAIASGANAEPERTSFNAIAWQQRALEYRANTLATYRSATAQLRAARQSKLSAAVEQSGEDAASKPPAVVLDIDETVLDNTPYEVLLLRAGHAFDEPSFGKWVMEASAVAVPGAREFVARARAEKLAVIFVSNRPCNRAAGYDAQKRARDCRLKAASLDNLERALGYRPRDADVVMRYELEGRDDSDKQQRRAELARSYRIALLIGDDLNDFIRRADYRPEQHEARWGTQWFALPNAMYGSWEISLGKDVAQRAAALEAWQPKSRARLDIVSWNLEWLADPALLESAGYWSGCAARGFDGGQLRPDLPFCDAYKKRGISNAADYATRKLAALRERLTELAPRLDILAVQETQSASALQAVLPPGFRVACFTHRGDAQNLGFALREAAQLRATCREVAELSQEGNPAVPRPVRRGLELTVTPSAAGEPALVLLDVHLKASCPGGRLDGGSADCKTLQQQVPALERWIEAQAAKNLPFAILGDWNRDLEAEIAGGYAARSDGSDPSSPLGQPQLVRNLWPELNDGQPEASAMTLARVDRSVAARKPTCHAALDQIALSVSLSRQLLPGSLVHERVPAALLTRPSDASDHCPLQVTLEFW